MNKKINIKSLIICILIPLLVGGISALITRGSMMDYAALNQPPLSPPGWLFPIVWTILYILMGVASYVALETPSAAEQTNRALRVYFLQLVFNFLWSVIFFSLGAYEIAFAWLLVLLALVITTATRFYRIKPLAGILLIPYIVWIAFAGYLNLAVSYLN